jgi:hypothetical protein
MARAEKYSVLMKCKLSKCSDPKFNTWKGYNDIDELFVYGACVCVCALSTPALELSASY